jgi:cell division septal protein FtsQ
MRGISEIPLRGEVDFLRRHNNRVLSRQKRIKSIKIKGAHLVLVFFLLVLTALATYSLAKFLLTWDRLNIGSYQLINSPNYRSAQLERILKKYDGNILSLNFGELRKELLDLKEVKDVAISRKLPSTVEIRFHLRKPVFQKKDSRGYQILDDEGVVLSESKRASGKLITMKNISRKNQDKLYPLLKELKSVSYPIEYIGYNRTYGVQLKLSGMEEIFYPGEMDYARKIGQYMKLRKKLKQRYSSIRKVDLRFNDRFYFEFDGEEKN